MLINAQWFSFVISSCRSSTAGLPSNVQLRLASLTQHTYYCSQRLHKTNWIYPVSSSQIPNNNVLVIYDMSKRHKHFPAAAHQHIRDLWRFSTAWYGTVRFSTVHFWGVFHWVLYLVPGTLPSAGVPSDPYRYQTWRVNSADHRLAGENPHCCVNELATRDPT